MTHLLYVLAHNPLILGAINGAFASFIIDLRVFASLRDVNVIKSYQIKIAAIRWLQGAASGVVSAVTIAGAGALLVGLALWWH